MEVSLLPLITSITCSATRRILSLKGISDSYTVVFTKALLWLVLSALSICVQKVEYDSEYTSTQRLWTLLIASKVRKAKFIGMAVCFKDTELPVPEHDGAKLDALSPAQFK